MRRITINTFATLDGVMQAPGGPEEDPSGGFRHGGWSVNYWDDEMGRVMDEFVAQDFDLLLGRKTYEIFAAHWPAVENDPMADALNGAHKYVASRTLQSADWKDSTIVRDVAREVAALKEEEGPEIQVHGSATLIQTLLELDLADVFRVWTYPLVLGGGKRLFGEGTGPANLRLVDSKTFSTGVIFSTYERAGDVTYGSFALAEPTAEELDRRAKQDA
jgi:dihydrofolate reductase